MKYSIIIQLLIYFISCLTIARANDVLPQAPSLPRSADQCMSFASDCYEIVETRRSEYQRCNSSEMRAPNPSGRFRDVSFPGCPAAAYKAYTTSVCESLAESYECGLASCRTQASECQQKVRELNEILGRREKEKPRKADLYDALFKSGKKWHDTQLKLRNVDAESKSVIKRIVERNFKIIESRQREILSTVDATEEVFETEMETPTSPIDNADDEPVAAGCKAGDRPEEGGGCTNAPEKNDTSIDPNIRR